MACVTDEVGAGELQAQGVEQGLDGRVRALRRIDFRCRERSFDVRVSQALLSHQRQHRLECHANEPRGRDRAQLRVKIFDIIRRLVDARRRIALTQDDVVELRVAELVGERDELLENRIWHIMRLRVLASLFGRQPLSGYGQHAPVGARVKRVECWPRT